MSAPARTVTIRVELPLAPADTRAPDPAVVQADIRRLWIIEQVRLKRLGAGKGAELAGMSRAAFMQELGAHGVPIIDYDPSDLHGELCEPSTDP